MGQTVDIRVAPGLIQQGPDRYRTDPHHRGIREITESLQMVGAVLRILGNDGTGAIDHTVADRIEHGLIFAHGVDDALRCVGAAVIECGHRGHIRQIGAGILPGQTLQRIGAKMHRPVAVREKAQSHQPLPGPVLRSVKAKGRRV